MSVFGGAGLDQILASVRVSGIRMWVDPSLTVELTSNTQGQEFLIEESFLFCNTCLVFLIIKIEVFIFSVMGLLQNTIVHWHNVIMCDVTSPPSPFSRMPCHDVTVSRCGREQQTGAMLSLPGRSYLKLDK